MTTPVQSDQSEYRNLPLDSLTESPNNPRRSFDAAALNELAESIKTQGILAPLVVRPVDLRRRPQHGFGRCISRRLCCQSGSQRCAIHADQG
jgi:hypothetical protein